jgi:hypothetical protein
MSRKSLILYASITGNTEKVAMRFKKVLEKNGWEYDMLKVSKHTDVKNLPYRLDDYDLLCVGSPVWSGIPTKEIFDDHYGVLMGDRLFREDRMAPITEGYGPKKGIAFVTYGGDRRGTPEALVALGALELRMEDMRVKCIGKFACPGGNKWSRIPVDTVAARKGWSVGDAAAAIARYRENPNHPEFASLSAEDQKLFAKAAKQTRDLPTMAEVPGSRGLHWDVYNRPSERDLLKAEIFLEEILEDYYGGGVEAAPLGQNLCIA